MDNINLAVTGRLGDAPSRNSGGEREFETRWYKVRAYGALAEHVAPSMRFETLLTAKAARGRTAQADHA